MFDINAETRKDIIIFHIKGDFFIENIRQVEAFWETQVSKNPRIIALNCEHLEHVDSSAIGTIVKFFNETMKKNINMVFFNLNTDIKNLFETAHLGKLFKIMTRHQFETEYLGE